MTLNTAHLERCIQTLESSLEMLRKEQPETVPYEVYRNAVIKGFELTLETSGKLLRKALKTFESNPRAVDELVYKDVLRHAAKHGLLSLDEVARWMEYRDNRNTTAHDYGQSFADNTLTLLPVFLADAKALTALFTARFSHA